MRLFILLLAVLLSTVCFAQTNPECVGTLGTQINFIESTASASLSLNGLGNFQFGAGANASVIQLTLLSLLQGAPSFTNELGFGYTDANCTAAVRYITPANNPSQLRTDLQAFLGQTWVSLTNSAIPSASPYSSTSTCGSFNETIDRQTACDNLFLRSSFVESVLNGSLTNIHDLGNPAVRAQFSPVSHQYYAVFGNHRFQLYNVHEATVIRSLLPDFSGVFDFAQFPADGPIAIGVDPLIATEYYFASFSGVGYIYYNCSYTSHLCESYTIGPALSNPQLFVDSFGALHLVYYSNATTLVYSFCSNFAALLGGNCNATQLASGNQVQYSYLSEYVGNPHLTLVSSGNLFSVVTLTSNPLYPYTQLTSTLVFEIFSCKPYPFGNGVNSQTRWFCQTNNVPRINDQLTISAPVYNFDAQITASGGLVIGYSYTNYQNVQRKRKRAVGDVSDAPNQSRADYAFRVIACANSDCHTYQTAQLLDSNPLFQKNFGSAPRGLRLKSVPNVNNGYPVLFFSIGSIDTTNLVTTPFYGGPIGIAFCQDPACASVSLTKSSDLLAGHVGEFDAIVTASGVLIGSPARRGTNWSPVFQYFSNAYASPNGQFCTAANIGTLLLIDNQVHVCTQVPASPIVDASLVFYWSPLVVELRSQLNNSPQSYQPALSITCPIISGGGGGGGTT